MKGKINLVQIAAAVKSAALVRLEGEISRTRRINN
jgi:hypothetical protein